MAMCYCVPSSNATLPSKSTYMEGLRTFEW